MTVRGDNNYNQLCALYHHLKIYLYKSGGYTSRLISTFDTVTKFRVRSISKIKYYGNGIKRIREIMSDQPSYAYNYWHHDVPKFEQLNIWETGVYDYMNVRRNSEVEHLNNIIEIKENSKVKHPQKFKDLPIFKKMKIHYIKNKGFVNIDCNSIFL